MRIFSVSPGGKMSSVQFHERSPEEIARSREAISIMGYGMGIYAFSIPKEKQAALIEKGLVEFRTDHSSLDIASVFVAPGHLEGWVKVFIVTNPPYEGVGG